jgi:hypothetical protein
LNDTITVGKGRKPTKKSKCCWKVILCVGFTSILK